jgi:hypothetical protein
VVCGGKTRRMKLDSFTTSLVLQGPSCAVPRAPMVGPPCRTAKASPRPVDGPREVEDAHLRRVRQRRGWFDGHPQALAGCPVSAVAPILSNRGRGS